VAKRKILVVDDEVDFVELMTLRLEANGYEVITANNGKDALDQAKKEKPDAILLDIMMPEMDGLTVLKKIRSEDARIPIFITTAFSNEERVKIAGAYNANGFIVKTQDLGKEIKNITQAIEIADKYKEKRA
jgi:two-component system alkaline phosphatase synthesis response regulator PhoP